MVGLEAWLMSGVFLAVKWYTSALLAPGGPYISSSPVAAPVKAEYIETEICIMQKQLNACLLILGK
jgi:hypothetical protein